MAGYANVPPIIGAVVSKGLATLNELQTVYDTEDLFDLYEIIIIKVANEQMAYKNAKERRKK